MNAIAIKPVIMKAIPNPLKGAGTSAVRNFSRIEAITTIAINHPTPEPKLNATVSPKPYSRETMKRELPKIAQFTVIKGKKMPNELYSVGEDFSMTISTNCTIAAIVEINKINRKNDRFTSFMIALSANMYWSINQLIGVVINNTKITAMPNPRAVLTVFDTAK